MLKRLTFALACLLVAACSSPGKQIVGHWTIDSSSPLVQKNLANVPGTQNVSLDMTDNKTFVLDTKTYKVGGTYTLTDHSAVMKVLTVNDKPLTSFGAKAPTIPDVKVKLSDDGKKLSMLSPTDQTPLLELIKSGQN